MGTSKLNTWTAHRTLIALMFAGLILPVHVHSQGIENPLLDLARLQEDGVRSKRVSSYDRTGGNNDRFERIVSGETRTLFDVNGAGMINHIWITIAPGPAQLNRNDIILRMFWDGSDEPCVETPIGPFFGQGWNESYNWWSLPLAAGPKDGQSLVSYFVMPFSNGARIEIENQADQNIRAFYFYVDYVELDELPENMARFHAHYRHELTQAPPEGENEWGVIRRPGENPKGTNNYVIADLVGKGHFAGVNYFVHSPSPMWYGEGDDMFFIDGEEDPSLHGTGTEDYFNTSWSPNELYTHPYFGYPRVNDDIGWLGRTHVYRFHITDPVYFNESLLFTIEHGHNNGLTLDLATVAYWYQSEPHKTFTPLPDKETRRPMPNIAPADIFRWREAWRQSRGNDPMLWGNERE